MLTRQDWRGPRAGWGPNDLGHWEVRVVHAADASRSTSGSRHDGSRRWSICRSAASSNRSKLEPGAAECTFPDVPLTQGPGRLEAWVEGNRNTSGVLDVDVASHGLSSLIGLQVRRHHPILTRPARRRRSGRYHDTVAGRPC